MIRYAIAISGALLAQACSPPSSDNNQAINVAAPDTRRFSQPAAKPPEAKPFAISEKTELLEFGYKYPMEAAAVPAIVSQFTDDLQRSKEDALKMAREDQAAAKKDGFPFHTHSSETEWTTKAATPLLLSLLAESYVYTGGAHGMTGYKSLIWDRANDRETSIEAMVVSQPTLAKAIGAHFCKALNAARAVKRGAPVAGNGMFDDCVDPMKQTLVPVSTDGKMIDQLLIVIGPYEAGPYAEGSYDIALPVDAAMLEAIKPEYREAFSAK
ncbi:hypothetical protein C1T17_14780 [Sphingobium sp. SCG-1]|uniref:DUF4163 domain-containing protein n=1 Tax=Sphingobium sp. SCG-1 TaxID=2072936 RepID=UPI000CD67BF9|nr:DUF4163 domain-containing protein [Sphingobium sp. SCG-1]AUW59165.1 hypothetical protein C1T17_14780 [Sphingobium sp. SCG-1]